MLEEFSMAQLMKGETWQDAQKLVRGKPRFEYPLIVEVKADEIRCQVKCGPNGSIQYLSYAGKPLHNLNHFDAPLRAYFAAMAPVCTELDCGIEVNGNFNDSYRWTQSSTGIPIRKIDKKAGKVYPALDVGMVKFILFDLPENKKPFVDRMIDIDFAADGLRHYGLYCERPARAYAHDEAEVLRWYNHFREQGHEGAMGKTLDHLYERKRTFGWMKIKPKETLDGVITGINRAHTSVESVDPESGCVTPKGTPLDRAGSVSVRFEDGSTADCGGLEHGQARDMFENPAAYIGQWAECERMEEDRAGGSRHPIFKRLREAK
jgi:hypothetical protein